MNRRALLGVLLGALLVPAAVRTEIRGAEPAIDRSKETLREYVQRNQGRFAYEIRLGGKKVGWAIDEVKLEKFHGEPAAMYSSRSHMSMSLFGGTVKHETFTVSHYRLSGQGELIHVTKEEVDEKRKVEFTVEPLGKGLRITTTADGQSSTREVAASRDTLAQMQQVDRWVAGHPDIGATMINYGLDLREEPKPRTDQAETYTYRGRAARKHRGAEVEVSLVHVQTEEEVLDVELLPAGQILTGKVGPIELHLVEDEADVRELELHVMDRVFEIPVKAKLGHPRELDALRLELTGVPEDFKFPESPRQRILKRQGERIELQLKRGNEAGDARPLTDAERKEYTRATKTIQSDHQRVQKIARQVAGREDKLLDQCSVLKSYIHGYVRPSYTDNARTSLEVLDQACGDCTECALLFVALARSLGIPAREVGGLLYVEENGRGAFTWHAWAEVHNGQGWVGVDPAWNEVGVDAAHIRLSAGRDDNHWVRLVSAMKIKVLEHTKR